MTAATMLSCDKSDRRAQLRRTNAGRDGALRLNGIEYVEIHSASTRKSLQARLLCPLPQEAAAILLLNSFRLWDEVGRRWVPIDAVSEVTGGCVRIDLAEELCCGRHYVLKFTGYANVDPQFATYRFAALADILDVDPKQRDSCPPKKSPEAPTNYLARDFLSFKQLIRDRLALLMPDWKEQRAPDLGVTLVELLAYVGDYLAYFQDAVGTEAYLHTARQRISVRRHARLVDYHLNEGCNARTFVQVNVAQDVDVNPANVCFMTAHPDEKYADDVALPFDALENVPPNSFQAFQIVPASPGLRALEPRDVTNTVGLIGLLATCTRIDSPAAAMAKSIWNKLPDDNRRELQSYASSGVEAPPTTLVTRLVKALNAIVTQHCVCKTGCPAAQPASKVGGASGDVLIRVEHGQAAGVRTALSSFIVGPSTHRLTLTTAHNAIAFYTWNGRECCLPAGATRATLSDDGEDGEDGTLLESNVDPQDECPSSGDQGADCTLSAFVRAHLGKPWRLGRLCPGDFLIFEELVGPQTHQEADADPSHRQVVRLTKVCFTVDPVTCRRIVEIEWRPEDALRFPLCLTSVGPPEDGCVHRDRISIARGNVALVDHGLPIANAEWLGVTDYGRPPLSCDDDGLPADYEPPCARLLRPVLQEAGLTFATNEIAQTAAEALTPEPNEATPMLEVYGFPVRNEPADSYRDPSVPPPTIVTMADLRSPRDLLIRYTLLDIDEQRRLEAILSPEAAQELQEFDVTTPENEPRYEKFRQALVEAVTWRAKSHLLASHSIDQDVVVEMDDERRPRLRFGDGELGRRPPDRTSFYAFYRCGNGEAGNIGADRIRHLVFRDEPVGGINRVWNPLPAQGGVEPETVDHAKMHAPYHFRTPQRAILDEDYRRLVQDKFGQRVQQVHASSHWMGAWRQVSVAVDPKDEVVDVDGLLREIEDYLLPRRRIGHFVRVRLPVFVPLQVNIVACVKAGFLRAHVRQELMEHFSSRVQISGERGFFHPDNFTFGSALHLSKIIAAAKRIDGVENVDVTRFERRGQGDGGEREAGVMRFGPLEIPRLDNDPNRPEFGCLCLDVRGSR